MSKLNVGLVVAPALRKTPQHAYAPTIFYSRHAVF